jgi:hypothetical protein
VSPTFVDNDGQPDWRKIGYHARSAFAVLLSAVVLFGGGWFVVHKAHEAWVSWRSQSDYIGEGKDEIVVVIPQNATVTQIGDLLVENGVIKSTRTFRSVAARQPETANKLQAGRFRLLTELPAETALKMLLDPANKISLKVTIPEGRVRTQQWEILTAELGLTEEQLTEASKSKELGLPSWAGGDGNLEGFLFPETYEVAEPVTAIGVLKQQVDQFKEVTGAISMESRSKDAGRNPYDVLIVASIVEKEAARPEDRPKIAQVIYNRLKKDMPLQHDSTVHYAIGQFDHVTTTPEDRATDSPYNTYKVKGLPPTPISNPGQSAIEAALAPSGEDFLYFTTVDLDTGETRYAKDEAGHQENVALFQQWCQSHQGRCV